MLERFTLDLMDLKLLGSKVKNSPQAVSEFYDKAREIVQKYPIEWIEAIENIMREVEQV